MPAELGQLAFVEDRLLVITRPTGHAVYDFDFGSAFAVRHPHVVPAGTPAVARVGAVDSYEELFAAWLERGVRLVNSPSDVAAAEDIAVWHPRLADLTPETHSFDALPDAAEVERLLGWPVFVKGNSQTSRHDATLSVARNAPEYEAIRARWGENAILRWQRPAIRRYVPLRIVRAPANVGELPRSFEFRTFWWRGELVGAGRYWLDAGPYEWTATERREGLAVAGDACARMAIPFLCIDLAQTAEGRWIVIEINDAQRSGYAGVSRLALWRAVLDRVAVSG